MPNVLVDSNVILDVVEDDPNWCEWSMEILDRYSESHQLIINPIVYAEVSIGFERIEELEDVLSEVATRWCQSQKKPCSLREKRSCDTGVSEA
jgi:hypothetical protein